MTTNITSPVGRIVQGSLYELNDKKDQQGKISVGKDGQPIKTCYFALAVPKAGTRAWWDTEWGKQIRAVGAASAPNVYQNPSFAWKVEDGDSTVPNKRGRKNCDQEGFAGNWIIKFSSGFLPKCFTLVGQPSATPAPLLEAKAIQPGYFVQVNFNVAGNGRTDSPGVYLNHNMVCLIAYGEVIQFGPDVESAGFGAGVQLPPGASLTPTAAFTPPATVGVPATPQAPAAAIATPQAPPYPQILNVPVPPGVTAAPAVPQAPPARRMTAKAAGVTYEAMMQAGWTDALLVQHGMMEA